MVDPPPPPERRRRPPPRLRRLAGCDGGRTTTTDVEPRRASAFDPEPIPRLRLYAASAAPDSFLFAIPVFPFRVASRLAAAARLAFCCATCCLTSESTAFRSEAACAFVIGPPAGTVAVADATTRRFRAFIGATCLAGTARGHTSSGAPPRRGGTLRSSLASIHARRRVRHRP